VKLFLKRNLNNVLPVSSELYLKLRMQTAANEATGYSSVSKYYIRWEKKVFMNVISSEGLYATSVPRDIRIY
jgi:hypothetical protein